VNAELALRAAGVGLALLVPAPALAQADGSAGGSTDTYLLVVSGIGGAPEYVDLFHGQARGLVDAALARGLPPERIAWLAEDPARLPDRISGRSTREAVAAEVSRLARTTHPARVRPQRARRP
jgi:hypothetical protein